MIFAGAKLIEDLVLLPDVRVRSWKLDESMSLEQLRTNLLYIRQLPVLNIVVMASQELTNRVLDQARRT